MCQDQPHYTNSDIIEKDLKKIELYTNFGYKVVLIHYFVLLSNKAVKTLFDLEIFDESILSLEIQGRNTPLYLWLSGIVRMAKEFKKFPSQYKINLESLR